VAAPPEATFREQPAEKLAEVITCIAVSSGGSVQIPATVSK